MTPLAGWRLAPVFGSKGDESISFMVTRAKSERCERPTGRTARRKRQRNVGGSRLARMLAAQILA